MCMCCANDNLPIGDHCGQEADFAAKVEQDEVKNRNSNAEETVDYRVRKVVKGESL